MGKNLFIAEKPSVAREFAKALQYNFTNRDGFMESQEAVVTWCVGHLVTMSYPEIYDQSLRRWSFQTLPFLPQNFLYEVIPDVKKQFNIVSGLLNRPDVDCIYVCTDSGREGEYIYRLVEQQAGVTGKVRKRVWIDSQTEEEILRGIREAKDLSAYDNLSDAAYLRAKEDYLMGINFSRALTLRYGDVVKNYLKKDRAVISVGRVMTCVLGMVVDREREIRAFVKTPFYRVFGTFSIPGTDAGNSFDGEWRAVDGSRYMGSPLLYKENGFKERKTAEELIQFLETPPVPTPVVEKAEKKRETRNAPLLYNLAELQNDCSRMFKISPDETLRIAQELYEKKLTTYPRTDARVLSSAVAKEINRNLNGLTHYQPLANFAQEVLASGSYKKIGSTRYTNDKQITDHYAIIPTGQGLNALRSVSETAAKVYMLIVRRFLSIFYPPAVYQKVNLTVNVKDERFFAAFKVLMEEGYLKVAGKGPSKSKADRPAQESASQNTDKEKSGGDSGKEEEVEINDMAFLAQLQNLKKGSPLVLGGYEIREGETTPPKRYNSGSMILTMENAGQFIEDEELRSQIKGSGIGTSATRAEILKKLQNIGYLNLNKKTQIITPTQMGEMIYDVVTVSIKPLLNPALTASWEKGLAMVADGTITQEEYMQKLSDFVGRRTNVVKEQGSPAYLTKQFDLTAPYYAQKSGSGRSSGRRQNS